MQVKSKFIAMLFTFFATTNTLMCMEGVSSQVNSQTNSQTDLKRMTSIPLSDDKSIPAVGPLPTKVRVVDRGDMLVSRSSMTQQSNVSDSSVCNCSCLLSCFGCVSSCCKPCCDYDNADGYRLQE